MRRQTLGHVQQMMTLRISKCFADRMQARGYHGRIDIDYELKQLKISVSSCVVCEHAERGNLQKCMF